MKTNTAFHALVLICERGSLSVLEDLTEELTEVLRSPSDPQAETPRVITLSYKTTSKLSILLFLVHGQISENFEEHLRADEIILDYVILPLDSGKIAQALQEVLRNTAKSDQPT